MTKNAAVFQEKSSIKAADLSHRDKINYNIGKYNAVVPIGKSQFEDMDFVRSHAKNIKWKSLENLDAHLEKFEKPSGKKIKKWH